MAAPWMVVDGTISVSEMDKKGKIVVTVWATHISGTHFFAI